MAPGIAVNRFRLVIFTVARFLDFCLFVFSSLDKISCININCLACADHVSQINQLCRLYKHLITADSVACTCSLLRLNNVLYGCIVTNLPRTCIHNILCSRGPHEISATIIRVFLYSRVRVYSLSL